jgi:hypothetical protein
MAPFEKLVEEEEKVNAVKEDTHLSQIEVLREQFAEAACQKGYDLSTNTTHSNNGTEANELSGDGIHGREYNDKDEDFSYQSLDGSAKEDADAHGELRQEVVGMLPMAAAGSKVGPIMMLGG